MVILLDFLLEEMTEKTDITERTGGILLRHSRSPRDRTGGGGSHGSGGTGDLVAEGAGMSILLIDLHIKLIVTNFAER
jgi:hypothetical protein